MNCTSRLFIHLSYHENVKCTGRVCIAGHVYFRCYIMGNERHFLYRLLREDENPLVEGIKAKLPLAQEPPWSHVRNGSRKESQWISTSSSLEATEMFVQLKKRKYGASVSCRVVKIHRKKLENYSKVCKSKIKYNSPLYQETFCGNGFRTELVPFQKKTGEILDFTNHNTLSCHLSEKRAKGYASKYCEVLVERYIPANCCICILNFNV